MPGGIFILSLLTRPSPKRPGFSRLSAAVPVQIFFTARPFSPRVQYFSLRMRGAAEKYKSWL
jgi:hypothetical protein